MEQKFDEYFMPISSIFGFGVLINPSVKEKGLNNLFDLLYNEPFED